MYEKYGIMTIKKNSKLYISSETNNFLESWRYFIDDDDYTEENKNKNVPIIHLTFHPSEFELYEKYISKIKLNRDIKLLFLLDNKMGKRKNILPVLDEILECKKDYYRRIEDESLKDISDLLKKNNLDGYFSTKTHGNKRHIYTEIGLINDLNIYSIVKTSELKRCWSELYIEKCDKRIKRWDNKYKICSIERPIQFDLNIRYKDLIDISKAQEKINAKMPHKFLLSGYTFKINTFDIILENAIINYFD